ncbi:hypothetical protein G4G27_13215 [Sphingomonas sp. So64.6b]|uniref:pilus assembly protein TadG-related protein n=1 Tax=Sphingomonas sp. So64.6b TaxID=2997354 RepID=UPI001601B39D|nr:pilus assembly protein TadG-related protein [Sphingomonas sp. So64.6b]QNA84847.1 hypothetical protein G4G27_13215 [Sphingomonas sp. So64.6b]
MARWTWPNRLATLARESRGGVTVLVAGAMLMTIGAAAVAVDVGSIYLGERQLQGVADAAALAAANASNSPQAAANAVITANRNGNAHLVTLVGGSYTPDETLAVNQRFVPGGTPANAVKISVGQDVPLFFGRVLLGRATTPVVAHASAARTDMASFSIGSRLAAVSGGLPGALLSGLAGTSLNLSVMDYNALVGANIDLLAFSDALRTQLHLGAATFAETLDATATLPQILNALAATTSDPTAAAAYRSMALKVPPTSVKLSNLIDLGPLGSDVTANPASSVQTDGYAIVREVLELANGGRQVALDLGVSLPGLLSTKLYLAIGNRPAHSPWLTVTKDNRTIVRTAQTRLFLDTKIAGGATLGLVSVRVPIFIELAEAQATLAAISCPAGQAEASVTLDVTPAVGQIRIADFDTTALGNFNTPLDFRRATIAHALLVDVTGQAAVSLGGVSPQPVTFSASDIATHQVKTVSTNDVLQGVATSLISQVDLRAVGLSLSPITAVVGALLTPVAPVLDGLIDQVTSLLGVRLGQADVQINGLRCGRPMLVG